MVLRGIARVPDQRIDVHDGSKRQADEGVGDREDGSQRETLFSAGKDLTARSSRQCAAAAAIGLRFIRLHVLSRRNGDQVNLAQAHAGTSSSSRLPSGSSSHASAPNSS